MSVLYWEWDEVRASSQLVEEYLASRLGVLADRWVVGEGEGVGVG